MSSQVDYNYENYDDGLGIVTAQLKSIQETQDVILAGKLNSIH